MLGAAAGAPGCCRRWPWRWPWRWSWSWPWPWRCPPPPRCGTGCPAPRCAGPRAGTGGGWSCWAARCGSARSGGCGGCCPPARSAVRRGGGGGDGRGGRAWCPGGRPAQPASLSAGSEAFRERHPLGQSCPEGAPGRQVPPLRPWALLRSCWGTDPPLQVRGGGGRRGREGTTGTPPHLRPGLPH